MSKNEIAEFQQFDLGEQAAAYATATPENVPEETGAVCNWLDFYSKSKTRAEDIIDSMGLKRLSDLAPGHPVVRVDGTYLDASQAGYIVLKAHFYNAELTNGRPTKIVAKPAGKECALGIVLVIGEDFCAPAMVDVKKWTKIQVLSRPFQKREEVATAALKKPGMDKVPAHLRVVNEFRITPKPGNKEAGIEDYAQVKSISRAIRPEEFARVGAFFTANAPGLAECEEQYSSKLEELRGLSA